MKQSVREKIFSVLMAGVPETNRELSEMVTGEIDEIERIIDAEYGQRDEATNRKKWSN